MKENFGLDQEWVYTLVLDPVTVYVTPCMSPWTVLVPVKDILHVHCVADPAIKTLKDQICDRGEQIFKNEKGFLEETKSIRATIISNIGTSQYHPFP